MFMWSFHNIPFVGFNHLKYPLSPLMENKQEVVALLSV